MIQYAWYSPRLDIIVIQVIEPEFSVRKVYFQSSPDDFAKILITLGDDQINDMMRATLWMPLGEL